MSTTTSRPRLTPKQREAIVREAIIEANRAARAQFHRDVPRPRDLSQAASALEESLTDLEVDMRVHDLEAQVAELQRITVIQNETIRQLAEQNRRQHNAIIGLASNTLRLDLSAWLKSEPLVE